MATKTPKWLDRRLAKWGAWCRNGGECGLGYPKKSALARIGEGSIGGFGPTIPLMPPDMINDVDRMVRSMGGDRAMVLRYRYVARLTIREIAEASSCSKSKIEAELGSALAWMEGALQAISE